MNEQWKVIRHCFNSMTTFRTSHTQEIHFIQENGIENRVITLFDSGCAQNLISTSFADKHKLISQRTKKTYSFLNSDGTLLGETNSIVILKTPTFHTPILHFFVVPLKITEAILGSK